MKEMIGLQLNEFDEKNMSETKKDMLIDDLKGLDDINEGDIKLEHVFMFPKDGGLEVGCFLRNASSSEVFFGDTLIQLINKKNGEKITENIFHMNEKFNGIGIKKARYFELFFTLDDGVDFEEDSLMLVWGEDLEMGSVSKIKYSFLEELDNEKTVIQEFIDELAPFKEDDVKVDCFSIEKGESGGVDLIILVRNSCEKTISLRKIGIKIKEDKRIVAGGEFRTEFIKVDAHEGKMFRFPIRKEHIYESNINFENCEVIFN